MRLAAFEVGGRTLLSDNPIAREERVPVTTPVDLIVALAAVGSAGAAFVAVVQARRERELAVLPIVVVEPEFLTGGFSNLRVSNVGLGPALDLEATISIKPEGKDIPLSRTVLAPNQALTLAPAGPIDRPVEDLARKNVTVSISGHCKNAFQSRVAVADSFGFSRAARDLANAGELVLVDNLVRVASTIEDLVNAVQGLSSGTPRRESLTDDDDETGFD